MINNSKDLLHLSTAGSVDDGKSTLIGRLLFETNSIANDVIENIKKISQKKGLDYIDYSLFLDGLSAERQQGITIDVAYRYFETKKRKFIIADTPGHSQYTRNMFTGASGADVAIILIDAKKGITPQSKRHGIILSLLNIPHLIVVINKMDLVNYSQKIYNSIVKEYLLFSEKLDIQDIQFIPISALYGDNITTNTKNLNWYKGLPLLEILNTININFNKNLIDFRFPIQYVINSKNKRFFAGKIISGAIKKGETIEIIPHKISAKITEIFKGNEKREQAYCGESVSITIDKEIDISRGDMLIRPNNKPFIDFGFDTIICWFGNNPLDLSKEYILRHTTKYIRAFISKLYYAIDVNTLHRKQQHTLNLNDIGRVEISTTSEVYFDIFKLNKNNGNFILIDKETGETVAAGIIKGTKKQKDIEIIENKSNSSPHIIWQENIFKREDWENLNKQKAFVLWFTGLSGSGKTTIAKKLQEIFFMNSKKAILLDGDKLRNGISKDLGFDIKDRIENIRRAGEIAKLFYEFGNIVICTFISPLNTMRNFVRQLIDQERFILVYLKCDINTCKKRDPKGLYKKAEQGLISNFTGISSPYEIPQNPELIIDTTNTSIEDSIDKILTYLHNKHLI